MFIKKMVSDAGGAAYVARAVGLTDEAVRVWVRLDRAPAKYWRTLAKAAGVRLDRVREHHARNYRRRMEAVK